MTRKSLLVLLPMLLLAGGIYHWLKPHQQDQHYYAAVCVVTNDTGKINTMDEFAEKLREVIINENSSYAFKKVSFDATSAEGALRRYQDLSPEQKSRTTKSMNDCLKIMLPDDQTR